MIELLHLEIYIYYIYIYIYIYILYGRVCNPGFHAIRIRQIEWSMYIHTYLPTPPLGQDITQGQFFKRSLTDLNSEWSMYICTYEQLHIHRHTNIQKLMNLGIHTHKYPPLFTNKKLVILIDLFWKPSLCLMNMDSMKPWVTAFAM